MNVKRDDDIFARFGHGVKAYFRMISYLIKTMFGICIFMIPTYIAYGNGKGFKHDRGYSMVKFTLGNFG